MLDNARQAVRDLNAIAYIGDRDSAATALSLPLTNEGHILQVSPSSTYDGLTRASRRQGEPDRFYPSGERTFGRVVPADHVQASALIGYMKVVGARSLALLADREIYGGGIADEVEKAAARAGHHGLRPRPHRRAEGRSLRPGAQGRRDRRRRVPLRRHDRHRARRAIFKAVAAAAPRMQLFGPAAVADQAFADALPAAVQRRMHVTTLGAAAAPAAARGARVPRPLPHDVRPPAGARGAAGLRGGRAPSCTRSGPRATKGNDRARRHRRRSSRSATASRCSAATRSTASATRACRDTPETVLSGSQFVLDKLLEVRR